MAVFPQSARGGLVDVPKQEILHGKRCPGPLQCLAEAAAAKRGIFLQLGKAGGELGLHCAFFCGRFFGKDKVALHDPLAVPAGFGGARPALAVGDGPGLADAAALLLLPGGHFPANVLEVGRQRGGPGHRDAGGNGVHAGVLGAGEFQRQLRVRHRVHAIARAVGPVHDQLAALLGFQLFHRVFVLIQKGDGRNAAPVLDRPKGNLDVAVAVDIVNGGDQHIAAKIRIAGIQGLAHHRGFLVQAHVVFVHADMLKHIQTLPQPVGAFDGEGPFVTILEGAQQRIQVVAVAAFEGKHILQLVGNVIQLVGCVGVFVVLGQIDQLFGHILGKLIAHRAHAPGGSAHFGKPVVHHEVFVAPDIGFFHLEFHFFQSFHDGLFQVVIGGGAPQAAHVQIVFEFDGIHGLHGVGRFYLADAVQKKALLLQGEGIAGVLDQVNASDHLLVALLLGVDQLCIIFFLCHFSSLGLWESRIV